MAATSGEVGKGGYDGGSYREERSFLIEKDHLGDWSPEKDCCLRLMFRQPVRKPSSESISSLPQLKIQKP